MYNDRRYSLARYSVNQDARTIEASLKASESMGAVVGAAVPVEARIRGTEAVHGSVRGTVSVVAAFSAAASLGAVVRMSADVVATVTAAEALQASAYGQKNIPIVLAAGEELTPRIWASKDIPSSLELREHLSGRVLGSKDITTALAAFDVLTSMMEATSQTTERAVFQLTIPSGGELRIDSELFTVLLNGENALHAQSGAWINLSRELLRLTVESASGGGLEGQLIYTERYL